MRVFVRPDKSRAIYVASHDHVLSIQLDTTSKHNSSGRKSSPASGNGGGEETSDASSRCVVEFVPRSSVDLNSCYPLSFSCYGCLGLIDIDQEVFLGIITERERTATPRPHLNVWKILSVEFISLSRPTWDGPAPEGVELPEAPTVDLRKLLSGGGFYYSSDFDLTAMLQNATGPESSPAPPTVAGVVDESFMWNRFLISELSKFCSRLSKDDQDAMDSSGFLTCVIRGFAGSTKVPLDHGIQAWITVISRQSWLRAGTRYLSRGIDDDGNVSNFVETETRVWLSNELEFGYVQLRGSVPCFWEQDASLMGAKLTVTRSPEAAQLAFDKHFDQLIARFGAVHAINLLGQGASEAELTKRYEYHLRKLHNVVRYTHFDFHKEVGGGVGYGGASRLVEKVQDSMMDYGFYSHNPYGNSDAETQQVGVFRTNCLDCLDRTNLVQQLLSKDALDLFCDYYHVYPSDELWSAHAMLWADNGDQLSHNYAGTGALKSSFTRSGKMNLAGALADVTKSVSRLYVNNFMDKQRQQTIDLILGRGPGQVEVIIFDPINDFVREELKRFTPQFSSEKQITVFAGTFNVNGKMLQGDLGEWLFPPELRTSPDIYMLGFQELVELTTSQILNVDSTRRTYWEREVLHCLNRRSQEKYILLRSGQLVGTAIMLFVKQSQMHYVTHVEGTSKKTALGGMTGNKGGIAVGFKFANTQFMFINSHLAAGMNNIEERHNDYKVLQSGLQLSRGKRIRDIDTVFWLGDFNYRVDLPNDTVRQMIAHNPKEKVIERLLDYDQLNGQMEKGETFPYYDELPIKFMPTYKFDPGTDTYDTSEKARVPSWTDRILTKGSNIHVKEGVYSSAPMLKFSDHRPVFAVYPVTVSVIDEDRRERLLSELYDQRRSDLGSDDLAALLKPAQARSLPYPSTDTKKWWAGEGLPTKVPIVPPRDGMVLNPEKVNPFVEDQPDFVSRDQVKRKPVASLMDDNESTVTFKSLI